MLQVGLIHPIVVIKLFKFALVSPEVCVPTCRRTQLLDVYAAWPPYVPTGSAFKLCCSHPDFAAQRAPVVIVFSWISIPRILRGFLTHQSNWGCSTSLAGVLHVANTCRCSTMCRTSHLPAHLTYRHFAWGIGQSKLLWKWKTEARWRSETSNHLGHGMLFS